MNKKYNTLNKVTLYKIKKEFIKECFEVFPYLMFKKCEILIGDGGNSLQIGGRNTLYTSIELVIGGKLNSLATLLNEKYNIQYICTE